MTSPTEWRGIWENMEWNVAGSKAPELQTYSWDESYRFDSDSLEAALFIPLFIVHMQSPTAAWGVLQFVSTSEWDGSKHERLHSTCYRLLSEALRLCKEKQLLSSACLTIEYHKLDKEKQGANIFYAKHCGRVRPSFCIRSSPDEDADRIFKIYTGMGVPTDHKDVTGCVFIAKNLSLIHI